MKSCAHNEAHNCFKKCNKMQLTISVRNMNSHVLQLFYISISVACPISILEGKNIEMPNASHYDKEDARMQMLHVLAKLAYSQFVRCRQMDVSCFC